MTGLERYSRWSAWERAVLEKLDDPAGCQRVILQRQREVDDDANEAEVVRDAIAALILEGGFDPDSHVVFIASRQLAWCLSQATGEKVGETKVSARLRALGINELAKKTRCAKANGWIWRGQRAKRDQKVVHLQSGRCVTTHDDQHRESPTD